ncbi:NIF3 1 [Bradyrhizobium sp. STM 3809]|uniref:NIF3 1 n=1 Tax=Bradyrhizobium sp. STM 3809 TaxID=551936 RepID=UPI00054E1D2A|nr:NIF3 1 [Bradyrhizobium sp. STM 3809]
MQTYKIVVYVPTADAEAVRNAMGEAGAGRIGNYYHCSFTMTGTGRFRPLAGANPAIGAGGRLEAVAEDRIETVCAEDRLKPVLTAIRAAHPYEEPAIDVHPLVVVE